MRTALAILLSTLTVPILTQAELQFDLSSVSSWADDTGDWEDVGDTYQTGDDGKRLGTKEGKDVIVNGPTGRTVNLVSGLEYADQRLHIEFMVPKGSNSGVYLLGRYEVQILDSWGVEKPQSSDCGGIYQRYNEKEGYGYEGTAPNTNASKAPGEWQSFDIKFQAPKFDDAGKKIANAKFIEVKHNGVIVHKNVEVTGPTRSAAFEDEQPRGPLMLQGDHGPVAYRNIRMEINTNIQPRNRTRTVSKDPK